MSTFGVLGELGLGVDSTGESFFAFASGIGSLVPVFEAKGRSDLA